MAINFEDENNESDLAVALAELFDLTNINAKSILNNDQIVAILRCKIFGIMYEVPEYTQLADMAMELLISGPGGKGGSGRKDMRHVLASAFQSKQDESRGLKERLMGTS